MVLGEQWEKSSGGRCMFLFAVAEDEGNKGCEGESNDNR
jgi:hypothetical protein